MVKFKDNVNVNELIEPIRELFNKTLQIKGINRVEVHSCNINRPNRYHLMIEMLLEKEALSNYDESEAHKTWKKEYGELIQEKAIFDCE